MPAPWIRLLPLVFCTGFAWAGDAPVKVWVELRDKGPTASGLTGLAWEDAPVHPPYLEALRSGGLDISVTLRWQNRISGRVEPSRVQALRALPFVRAVEEFPRKVPQAPARGASPRVPPSLAKSSTTDFWEFGALFAGTGLGALRDTLALRGLLSGQGVRIALMDADFFLGHRAFDSLRASGRIVDQWDFVGDTSVAVLDSVGPSHGALVLSLLAGRLPGTLEGAAPDAEYLLYRTEDELVEDYVEEDFLAAAFERAVDSGAQVINVSLGYRYDFDTLPDFPHAMMDGRTRPSSLAAIGAARRGAIVVVAAGNEGLLRDGEPTLTAPADADSILAVGMVTAAGTRCGYSSTGPSFDGRIKPDLSSLGCIVRVASPATLSGVSNSGGTSVGAPVVAGAAALLLQLHPGDAGVGAAQQVRRALLEAASRAANPDNLAGHGLMRAAEAHCALAFGGACVPPRPPLAAKGVYMWRGGTLGALPWPNDLDMQRARAWDLQGRSVPIRGTQVLDDDGNALLRSPVRRAPGPYILRVPAVEGGSP